MKTILRIALPMLCVCLGALLTQASGIAIPPDEAGDYCKGEANGDIGTCAECCRSKTGQTTGPAVDECYQICIGYP
jgi:hypothetical protein